MKYMRTKCGEWKNGMNFYKINYRKLFLQCLSDSVNEFVSKISWKFFIVGGVFICIYSFIKKMLNG